MWVYIPLYLNLFILRSACWTSCCPHADRILPKISVPQNRMTVKLTVKLRSRVVFLQN
jgi:hypothetical protein